MKKLGESIFLSVFLKTMAFILFIFCLGAGGYLIVDALFDSSRIYDFEESAEEALVRDLREAVYYIENSELEKTASIENKNIIDDIKSELDSKNIDYYISVGGSVITNTGITDPAYYSASEPYYICSSADGFVYKPSELKIPGPAENMREYSDYGIYLKINDSFAAIFINDWNMQKVWIEHYLMICITLIIAAAICAVYLLWVCGRSKDTDKVCILFIDRMYVEINLLIMVLAAAGAIAATVGICDEMYNSNILHTPAAYAVSVIIAAAGAVVLALMMSIGRNLKNHSFLKHSLIAAVLRLCLKILKRCISIAGFVFVWIFRTVKRLSGSAAKTVNKTKQRIIRAVGGKNGKIGIIAVFALCVYTAVVVFCSYMAVDNEGWLLIPAAALAAGVYVLFKALAEADMIKEGIFEIRNGRTGFKIEGVSGSIAGEIADAVNTISDGLALSVEREVKAERMKSELITNVSHDLKTPLTSIINYAGLLCDKTLEPAEANDYVRIIYRKAERLKKLTADLFDVSKAQSGNEEINIERLDLGLLISQSLAEQEENIGNSGLDFQLSAEKDIYVKADGKKLSRVFENLITNALKYSMKGTRVYINAVRENNECVVEIKNIASYQMNFNEDEITERFVRGDVSRSTEGSGLGLAIAKSYTELCGGKFSIIVDGDLFKARLVLNME